MPHFHSTSNGMLIPLTPTPRPRSGREGRAHDLKRGYLVESPALVCFSAALKALPVCSCLTFLCRRHCCSLLWLGKLRLRGANLLRVMYLVYTVGAKESFPSALWRFAEKSTHKRRFIGGMAYKFIRICGEAGGNHRVITPTSQWGTEAYVPF